MTLWQSEAPGARARSHDSWNVGLRLREGPGTSEDHSRRTMKTAFRHVGASGGERMWVEERTSHMSGGDGAQSGDPPLRVSLPPLRLCSYVAGAGAQSSGGAPEKEVAVLEQLFPPDAVIFGCPMAPVVPLCQQSASGDGLGKRTLAEN